MPFSKGRLKGEVLFRWHRAKSIHILAKDRESFTRKPRQARRRAPDTGAATVSRHAARFD
jgi:hypothetical protein